MNSIVGFSLSYDLPPEKRQAAMQAQNRALGYFTHLRQCSVSVGESRFECWGHNQIEDRMHYLSDGSLLALIGSPLGSQCLADLEEAFADGQTSDDFELPWDGRFILLHVAADGKRWSLWNDWLGSIPVFHTRVEKGRIASTLEPVLVAAAGYTADDFFVPGLLSLLINGHYLSDWTLYREMKIMPPDSLLVWDASGFRPKRLWTVQPSQDRWEASWNDLVDEMYELSSKAIGDTLSTQPAWTLTLSAGLDSRLIAGVAANIGANVHAFAWGGRNTTDVNYSRQIARTLGIPWRHIELRKDFLAKYTPVWANLFGSAMAFHGMYQMCFLDALQEAAHGPVISGYFGDVIAGDGVADVFVTHSNAASYQIVSEWYSSWAVNDLRKVLKVPYEEELQANLMEIKNLIAALPGAFYQKVILLECWSRQRLFTSFQAILKDYWQGVATPFLNRAYARFCLSLPRAVMDERRLLTGVFQRYYGRLAVIPGTYAKDPLILTGRYLILRRIADMLRPAFHFGPLRGLGNVQLRLDIESIQATGKKALWPVFEMQDQLAAWLDIDRLDEDYRTIMNSKEDIRPLRRLQAAQTLAYRLIFNSGGE